MAKKSNPNLPRIVAAGVLVVLAGGFWLYKTGADHKAAVEKAAGWMITGTPCPVAAAGVAQPDMPRTMTYDGVGIAREVAGQAACESIKENGDGAPLKICQFLNPGAIKVTTAKGTYGFSPGRGVDASLVVRDDVPTCVMHVNPAVFN